MESHKGRKNFSYRKLKLKHVSNCAKTHSITMWSVEQQQQLEDY